ncbi:MAG: DUF2892 domain-containing protein [Minwuia sp.]|uniref:YgaP family membrane protein n=1 Tax=Minwuia sp. TaxID=2493630 RepID=UPI003A850D04
MLKKNMHIIDQAARVLVGVALLYAGFVDRSLIANDLVSWALGAFGALNLVSGLLGHCPVYWAAGLSTRSRTA